MMGATLANMGRHPLTGESVFDIGCVRDMLSICSAGDSADGRLTEGEAFESEVLDDLSR